MVTMSAPDTSGLGMRSFVHSMTQTKPFRRWIKFKFWTYFVSEVKGRKVLCKQHLTPSIDLTTCCQKDGDGPERDGQFSQKIDDKLHIRPHKMAALKVSGGSTRSPEANSISNNGVNPQVRSLTVDEFSQKIHAELLVRPHKLAALKVSELHVSPHKLAAFKVSGGSTRSTGTIKLNIRPTSEATTCPKQRKILLSELC